MYLDLADGNDGRRIRTQICVVGAGAAGISLTRRLLAAGHELVLLESGGLDYEKRVAELNRGDIVGTDYYRLEDARLRFFGGTTAIWGGRCTELDPIDFERRDYVPHSGWPFGKAALESYYREAHAQFGLREAGPEALAAAGVAIPPFNPQLLRTPIWTFDGQSDRFTFAASRDLADHRRCRVVTHATVISIDADPSGNSIRTVTAKAPNGCKLTVAADMFVLAAGGIENPRLLLASRAVQQDGLGNAHDQVGRFFMEHPHARGGRIDRASAWPLLKAFARRHRVAGQDIAALIAPAEALQRREGILNTSLTIVGRQPADARQALGMRAYSRIKHDMAPTRFGRTLWTGTKRAAGFAQRTIDPLRPWLLHKLGSVEIALLVRGEQAPNPASRVLLTDEPDALGVPRVALDWQLSELDVRSVRVLVDTLGAELARLDMGKVERAEWLARREWLFDRLISSHPIGGYHHMGTTRMSSGPRHGVTDADGRVHGIDNLYVAGSSLFPTSGWANPTLTIVALALRAGDRISERLNRPAQPAEAKPAVQQPRPEPRIPAGFADRLEPVWRTRLNRVVAAAMILVGGFAMMMAPLTLATEFVEWLTGTEWPNLTIADALDLFGLEAGDPETQAQLLFDFIYALPLTVALFLLGLFMLLAGLHLAGRSSTRAPAKRRHPY